MYVVSNPCAPRLGGSPPWANKKCWNKTAITNVEQRDLLNLGGVWLLVGGPGGQPRPRGNMAIQAEKKLIHQAMYDARRRIQYLDITSHEHRWSHKTFDLLVSLFGIDLNQMPPPTNSESEMIQHVVDQRASSSNEGRVQ